MAIAFFRYSHRGISVQFHSLGKCEKQSLLSLASECYSNVKRWGYTLSCTLLSCLKGDKCKAACCLRLAGHSLKPLDSTQYFTRKQQAHILSQAFCCSPNLCFLMCYAWLYISWMANDVENLFIRSLAICLSFLVRCLCKSFDHFNWLFYFQVLILNTLCISKRIHIFYQMHILKLFPPSLWLVFSLFEHCVTPTGIQKHSESLCEWAKENRFFPPHHLHDLGRWLHSLLPHQHRENFKSQLHSWVPWVKIQYLAPERCRSKRGVCRAWYPSGQTTW